MKKLNKQISIYLIDDDKPLSAMVTSYLNREGFQNIRSFISGEDGIKAIEENQPELVLQDYDLPGINGVEVLRKVKKKYPNIGFIIFSGQSDMQVAIDALTLGAFDYVIKDKYAKENAKHKIRRFLLIKKLESEKKTLKYLIGFALSVLIVSYLVFGILAYK